MAHRIVSRHKNGVEMAAMRPMALLAVSGASSMASNPMSPNGICNTAKHASKFKTEFENNGGKGGNVGNPQPTAPTFGDHNVSD